MAQQVDDLSQPVQTADGVVPKHSFNWTRLIITIVLVVLTAGALGGGVWYYMNQQSLKAEDAKNKEVEQLQKQIDELKKPAATSTATATTASATDWKTYRNTDYGFQLTFPEAWKGYKLWEQTVEGGGTKTWYVELPTTDTNYAKADATHEAGYSSLFALSAYTKAQWDADQAQEGPKSTLLKTIGQYTFGYSYAQAGPTDIPAARRAEIQSILATFKAN